jgi:hypothetical protein
LLRVLDPYRFRVNVLPEDDGSFTLWLRELNVAGSGPTLRAARADLLAAIRSYAQDYLDQVDFYRHLKDLAEQEPYVLRLSLAKDDAELVALLFGRPTTELPADSGTATAAPTAAPTAG